MPFQPSPQPRRRLRRRRLLRRRPALRHARRLRRVHACGASSAACACIIDLVVNHTSDQHPWFQERARATRSRPTATGTSGPRRSRADADKGMVFPGVQKTTWTYDRQAQGLVLPPLLRVPAGPQHLEPRGAGRDPEDHGLLDPARRGGLPHGRGAVRDRRQGRGRDGAGARTTTCCAASASSCSGGGATRSSWPRPTCCRTPTWSISATTATACT